MPLTKRFGSTLESGSMRVKTTAVSGSASPFLETKTRPVEVAAQIVDVSPTARSTAATVPPILSLPNPALLSAPAVLRNGPSRTQSPHAAVKVPVHSLQVALNVSRSIEPMPEVLVLQTC